MSHLRERKGRRRRNQRRAVPNESVVGESRLAGASLNLGTEAVVTASRAAFSSLFSPQSKVNRTPLPPSLEAEGRNTLGHAVACSTCNGVGRTTPECTSRFRNPPYGLFGSLAGEGCGEVSRGHVERVRRERETELNGARPRRWNTDDAGTWGRSARRFLGA